MRIIFLSLFIVFSLPAISKAQTTTVYNFGNLKVSFWSFPEQRLLVSSKCIDRNQLIDCQARQMLKDLSFSHLVQSGFGGENPGALLCEQQGHGQVLVAINPITNNEVSFCKLEDGSIIDTGTLLYYGQKNDKSLLSH